MKPCGSGPEDLFKSLVGGGTLDKRPSLRSNCLTMNRQKLQQ
jgi:hypothetical protein